MAQIQSSGRRLAVTGIDGKVGLTTSRRINRRDTRAPWDEHASRYRLHVAAPNVVDLITAAGGWLADRAMAGWEVTGFIADLHDDRPLQILGVDPVQFHPALDLRDLCAADSLAISPDLFIQESRIRMRVSRAATLGKTEILFMGEAIPAGAWGKPTRVKHQCSTAAVAFKRHALAAAGLPADGVADYEVLLSWSNREVRAGCHLVKGGRSDAPDTESAVGERSRSQRLAGSVPSAVRRQRIVEC
jgi:hypothetical protein